MITTLKTKTGFKAMALAVAFSLLWQQISWADDLAVITLENLNQEQSQTFAPAYLQDQQTAQESMITQKQAVEDIINLQNQIANNISGAAQESFDISIELQGPKAVSSGQTVATSSSTIIEEAANAPGLDGAILSVTTQDGDIVHYANGAISSIEKKDGTVLRDLVIGGNDNLLAAEITYIDGTIQIVNNGRVTTIKKPDKTILNYNDDETLASISYPDDKTVTFLYIKDTAGAVMETILTDSEKASYYGSDNKLKRVEFNAGKTIEYQGGVISKITEMDLSAFIFNIKTDPDGGVTSSIARYTAASGSIYDYAVDEDGSLSAITIEKDGVAAAYDKDGNLTGITKDGLAITLETIAQAQADYDAALLIYGEKEAYRESCRINLDNAGADLGTKGAARDYAEESFSSAVQSFNNAQAIKDSRQSDYDTAYSQYLASKVVYDADNAALNTAISLETQAGQALIAAQSVLASEEAVLNQKTIARQALEAEVAGLNTELQSDEASLAEAQQSLAQALNEEAAAGTAYNSALADVSAKEAIYNNAVQARQAKEAAFNNAAVNLANVSQAKTAAENALYNGSPYIVSSYTNSAGSLVLSQYKNFINDQFDSYNSGLWYKPADSLVAIGGGSAILKGTGKNYNATLYSNQSYSRSDMPVLATSFKVSSASGRFIAALDGYTSSSVYRRVGIFVQSGKIYVQTVNGAATSNTATLVSGAKANTNYNLQFDVTSQDIKIYLWESAAQKPAGPSYTYTITDWTTVRPYYSLYSGTATVDYAALRGPNYNSIYDSNSQLIKDSYQDGNVSTYSYSANSITVSEYKQYLDSPYDLTTAGLWYKPADSLVTIGSGVATLKGTGSNYNAAFYSNQTFARASNDIIRSNFQVSSTSGNFIAAIDGYTSSNAYRRVGVTVQSGKIYVQTVSGSKTTNAATLVSTAKANTNYTVEFQATSTDIKIFLWESSAARPANPSYTYTVTDWSAVRPYYSVYSGTATVSNVFINYVPQVRTITQGSTESNQILARNQLVKNLGNAIVNVNTAQAAYDTANTDLNNAKTVESLAQQNLTNARNTLAARLVVLNNKIAARQAIQTTIANLNTEIATHQRQLSQAQQSLNIALSDEAIAQSGYNNAQAAVIAKQTIYNNAVQDRKAKETALNIAATDLAAKTTAVNQVYTDLQAAVQNLATAQATKNASQAAYDSAYAAYLLAQTAYNQALTDFDSAKSEEGAAKASADSLLKTLNALLSVSSLFPQEDSVLQNANSELEAVSILYDAERRVKEVHKVNGDIQNYADGLVGSIVSGSETTLYSYDLSALDNINEITVDRDGIKRIYDKYGNIKSLSLDDATKIVYEDGQVKEIRKADGTTLKNMTFRDSGELDSALVSYPDGSLALYDDAKLLQAISASGDITDYSDGKIRKVTLEDGAVYDWSYDGDNLIILDNAKGEKRTYFEGRLISLEELTGVRLVTRYYYDETSGDLIKSEICRNNEILYTYTYAYEDGLTLVRDEDGNAQAYTRDKKLAYIIDFKGRKYSYTYVGKNEGYVDVYFPSGNRAKYDLSGNIIDITRSDGTIIKDITFCSDNTPQNFTYIKDGAIYKVEDGKIKEVSSKDGAKTLYYDNGFVRSVETEVGDLTEYQYFVKDNKVFNSSPTFLNGSLNQISLYNSNSTAYLELSRDTLQFGTGLDGAKRVTADETLEAGIYNFESLTIDPGKTLIVGPGAIIKALDTVTVNGAIFCGGSLDIYAPGFNVGASGSVTGAVNIRCDTINNSGIITGNASMTGTGSGRYYSAVDDNFGTGVSNYVWGMSDVISVAFPSCDIQKAMYRVSLGSYGLPAYAGVYLCVNGSWTCIASYSGGGDSGIINNTTGWSNVTGMMMTGQSLNGDCVSSSYNLCEMQAIIGTPTIEYINGNPGTVNTTPSRPAANIKEPDHPSSGTFESEVIELNALELGSISWSQELPEGTNITFQTRSGDTPMPDSTWSEWSAELTGPVSSQITSPEGKYIQYRVNLATTNPAVTPLLKLGENSPITFGYSRAPGGSSELSSIYYATASKDGVTSACDKNSLSSLVFNADYMDAITGEIPGYLLNDTQKELYLKDSVIISELTAIKSVDGTTTEYCQGQISKITRSDGTVIKSASFDADNNAEDFTYSKDGSTYIVKDGKIDTVITAAGESIKYYSYGLIESVETVSSKKEYEYGVQTDERYTTKSVFQNGTFNSVSFLGQGPTTYLELSKDTLQFGTGSDGAKHVTADETLEAGIYNFESLTIDPGKTLIVGSDTIIKALGTVAVNGAIFCGGSLNIYAPSFNVGASGSVTGAVNIRCDTINNSGIITGNVCLTGVGGFGATTDDNFSTGIGGSHGASGNAIVTFPDCDIARARYRASLGNYGLPAYANVYLLVNGSWTCIASYAGAGDSGEVDNTAGWPNVTGMMMTGQSLNGNCVCSSYFLYEMQAIIGTSTIEYISGNPGTVNTTPSRPTANIEEPDHPSSGTFESEVIELNALELGSISWSQELPEGTNITFQTRTGDTAAPDSTWSEWSQVLTDSGGSDIASSGKRYLQYKINLSTSDPAVTPKVLLDSTHDISISYIKISDNPLDPYVKVKNSSLRANEVSEAILSAYNKSGILIWTEDITGIRTHYDPANPEDTIDLAPLKFDPSYTDSLTRDIPSSKLSDAQKVITVYDQGNDTPVEIISADQSITYFDQGFAAKVVDKNGVTQVLYTYNEDKDVTKVEFVEARKQLEENFWKAQAEIVTKKEDALAKLVKAGSDAEADVERKSADIQKQIDNERSRLMQEKAKYDPSVYDLSEFSRAFAELDSYEARLEQQKQDAYADIAGQVSDAKAKVEADASKAQQDLINNDYNKILCDIVQKESSPLLYQYYRKVLGRDPGDDELLYWMNKVKAEITPDVKADIKPINATEITQYIRNLLEYEERAARKENIISELTTFFTQYISAGQAQKDAMAASLGLSPDETANLTQADIDAILSWLNGQSLHFGDSAVQTIIAMLKNNGINRSFEDIDKDLLKIDILTGVIAKDTKGDFVISMYAMRKAAALNGLTLYSEKINYNDLKDKVEKANVICHIDGKHFVLVTGIDDANGTVTYTDTTVGQNGQEMTVTRLEFMGSWRGYAQSKELTPDSAKHINVTVEKNIRGSGWWKDFWRGVVDLFNMILPVVAVVLIIACPANPLGYALLGINVMIQTIAAVVSIGTWMNVVWSIAAVEGAAIFGGVTSALSKAVGSITHFISPGLQGAFTSAANLFNPLATVVGNIATFGTASSSAIAASVGFYVIAQAVSVGTNYLFKGLHIDPTLADIGSALISGAITGLGNSNPGVGVVGGILQSGTIAGVDVLGKAVNLDPNITHLAGMMAGSIIGGSVYTGAKEISYVDIMKSIAPYIYSECAYIGVTKIGELLGIDSRISYLAGIGIRSSLQAGLSSQFDPEQMWNSVTTGLLQGVTSIGISYATQELGLNPLLANIGFSAISAGINAGLQFALGQIDPDTGKPIDYFKAIYNTYEKNALTFLGYGDPNNAWQQAAYVAQIQDFTKIATERGFVDALNTYGAGFFNAVAINSIVTSGMSIGQYFASKLVAGQYTLKVDPKTGTEYKEVGIGQNGEYGAGLFTGNQEIGYALRGKTEEYGDTSFWGFGDVGIDAYGKMGFTDAELYSMFGSDVQYQRVVDGQQTYAEIKDLQGNTVLVIEPTTDGHYNVYNSYGDYVNAVIGSQGYNITLKDGFMEFENNNNGSTITFSGNKVTNISLWNLDNSFSQDNIAKFSNLSLEQKTQVAAGVMMFGSGFGNEGNPCQLPHLMQLFMNDVIADGIIGPNSAFGVTAYEGAAIFPDDCLNWSLNAWGGDKLLTNQIMAEIDTWMLTLTPEQKAGNVVYFAHSGNFNPLIIGLNERTDVKIDTIINYEGPYVGDNVIDNPNIKRIINVDGTGAPITVNNPYQLLRLGPTGLYLDISQIQLNDNFVPFLQPAKFQSATGIENINFEITGARHSDFSHATDDPINVATNLFMRELSNAAVNSDRWNVFIQRDGITYDTNRKVYVVDPLKFKRSLNQ